jgi:thiol:disulfide interchange protein DsbC
MTIFATRAPAISRATVKTLLVAVAVASMCATPAVAAEYQASGDARLADMQKLLQSRLPDVQIEQVLPSTALPGMYDVITTSDVLYVDASLQHVVVGRVYQSDSGDNLSRQRWDALHAVDFSSLPLQQAIHWTHGKGRRRLAVFADPLCPYCQQLEQTLQGLDDVSVYIFLMPLETVHPGASEKSRRIWCSSDQGAAWNAWMMHSQEPAVATCGADPLNGVGELAAKLKVTSTPTIFFADGQRATGAMEAEGIARALDRADSRALAAGAVIYR